MTVSPTRSENITSSRHPLAPLTVTESGTAWRGGLDAQVEGALGGIGQHLPRPLDEDSQLSLGVRRPHVGHDLAPAIVVLGNLHGRSPRCRPYPPNPCHGTEPRAPISA